MIERGPIDAKISSRHLHFPSAQNSTHQIVWRPGPPGHILNELGPQLKLNTFANFERPSKIAHGNFFFGRFKG
jgi:hypothetical protein